MTRVYKIEVECANCANKMEVAAVNVPGISEASINFMTQKMTVSFADGAEPTSVMKEVLKACRKVEPDCEIEL